MTDVVAVDVGGTFTDICVLARETGELRVAKVPSTGDPIRGVMAGVEEAGVDLSQVALFSHGTTVATNALLTGSFPPAAMVTTKGFRDVIEIRVVMGLYDHLLSDAGRCTFLETTWTLTPVADRVGFRYKGPKLEMLEREQPFGAGSDPSNIVDAPYPIGSIQIPGGVEPIVLHRDAVSGGGYAMVATVISADMDAVAQSAPGAKTRFVPVTLEEALTARAERRARLERLREATSA